MQVVHGQFLCPPALRSDLDGTSTEILQLTQLLSCVCTTQVLEKATRGQKHDSYMLINNNASLEKGASLDPTWQVGGFGPCPCRWTA